MTGAVRPEPGRGEGELVAGVAELAELALDPDRIRVLAELLPAARAEQATLRDVPPDIAPHAVFDPRWD